MSSSNAVHAGGSYLLGLPSPFHKLRWEPRLAHSGEEVKLRADCRLVREGEEVTLEIFDRERTSREEATASVLGTVARSALEASWTCKLGGELHNGGQDELKELHEGEYVPPGYYFIVRRGESVASSGCDDARLLLLQGKVEFQLTDEEAQPIPYARYVAVLPNKEEVAGRTDREGWARIDGVLAGAYRIHFPDFADQEPPSSTNGSAEPSPAQASPQAGGAPQER